MYHQLTWYNSLWLWRSLLHRQQVIITSVTVNNSPIQDYVHSYDHAQPTCEMTHGFIFLYNLLLLRFSQTCEFWSSKANWSLRFSLPSIILTDLLGNKTLLERVQKVICDWWISIRFVSFCVLRFVASDRNYDWRQRKTQLWRRLLNFRIRKSVKSAVTLLKNYFVLILCASTENVNIDLTGAIQMFTNTGL